MEADLLLWIHGHASPLLDAAFVLSWVFGTRRFCVPLVLLAAAWHLGRRQRREALAWVAVGLAVAVVPELLKAAFARPRPTLWPWLLPTTGYAFPSGHAVAGMAFYPLLGWLALRGRASAGTGYLLGALFGVYVGRGASLPRRPLAERRPRRLGDRGGAQRRRRARLDSPGGLL